MPPCRTRPTLGLQIKPIYDRGDLVPDELTVALIRERLAEPDAAAGFVLDGFPRNLHQAEALDAMLAEIGRGLDAILFFDLDDETATERALGRAHEEGRADDTPEGIARRLDALPRGDRAGGRALPRHREARSAACGALDRTRCRRRSRTPCAMIDDKATRDHPQDSRRRSTGSRRRARSSPRRSPTSASRIEPGVTTGELDRIADRFIRCARWRPTSMGYKGYPAAICISPNAVVVHGIPGSHRVQEGDVITIDVGVTLAGYIADSAYTFAVGRVDAGDAAAARRGAGGARRRYRAGAARQQVGDISHAVQEVVEGAGFSVVRSLVGHGVGRHYHEDPHVPNFGLPGPRAAALGGHDDRDRADDHGRRRPEVYLHDDGWTIITEDGSTAAHFEHTVAITDEGPRILTPRVGIAVERARLLQ